MDQQGRMMDWDKEPERRNAEVDTVTTLAQTWLRNYISVCVAAEELQVRRCNI